MVGELLLVVEEHQDAHLVGRDGHLVLLLVVSDLCSDLSLALVQFPVELPPRELRHVVLLEDAHALLDLRRK